MTVVSNRLPTSYVGISQPNPPNIWVRERDPTANDFRNYTIGDEWWNKVAVPPSFWKLTNKVGPVASWENFAGGGSGDINTLTGDLGGAVSSDSNGNVNIRGAFGQVIVTGIPNTNTLEISLAGGGTAIDTINGVGPDASGNFSLTSSGSSLSITNITNGQNLDIAAGAQGAPLIGAGPSVPPTYSTTFKINDSTADSFIYSNSLTDDCSFNVQNTGGSQFAYILATAASTKTGFFASGQGSVNLFTGAPTGQYWCFGMQSINANAYAISYNASGAPAPESGVQALTATTAGATTIGTTFTVDPAIVAATQTASLVGGVVQLTVQNTDASNTNSGSRLNLNAAQAGGDVYILFDTVTGSGGAFEVGVDNTTDSLLFNALPDASQPLLSGTTVASVAQNGLFTLHIANGAVGAGIGLALGVGGPTVTSGAGAPTAAQPQGSLYLRTDGSGVNTRAYIATDAVGGWTAIVTVA